MSFHDRLVKATDPGKDQQIPGAVAIAANSSGEIRHLDFHGSAAVDGRTIAPDSVFWIASCTKLVTTIAVMQCVERGTLNLDADISSVLPEWESPKILTGFDATTGEPQLSKSARPITLRQLLTHSSGMGYEHHSSELGKWRSWRNDDIGIGECDIATQYLMPLIYEPGDSWQYSCSVDWAGQMVERVNGNVRLGEYMKANIFDPLGMTSTGFRLAENASMRSQLYPMTARLSGGQLITTTNPLSTTPKDDLGGGGLYSSPDDFIKILVAILKNDGTLLKADTVHSMFKPQLADTRPLLEQVASPAYGPMMRSGVDSSEWNFGLGGILNMADVDGICHKGTMTWGGRPNLYWWIDPIGDTCGLYFSQLIPTGDPTSLALAIAFRREVFASKGR